MWIDGFLFLDAGASIVPRLRYIETEDLSGPRLRAWLPYKHEQEPEGLFLDNDFQIVRRLYGRDPDTGRKALMVGESALMLTGFITSSRTGTSPIGGLTTLLTEYSGTGMYAGSFAGTAIRTALAGFAGRIVYVRLRVGIDDYLDAVPFVVREVRQLAKPIVLPVDNDFEVVRQFYRRNSTTGVWEPAVGLTGIDGFITASRSGLMPIGTLSGDLAERDTTGQQVLGLAGAELRSGLLDYRGRQVFIRVRATGYLDSLPSVVQEVRSS